MKLRDLYGKGKPVFSFEFFPPKTAKAEESLMEAALRLKALDPSFFSMTYGAGGGTREKTVSLARQLMDRTGIETVCHLTCVGQSREEIGAIIDEIRAAGMENVMALRGDPPRGESDWKPHPDGFSYASELVEEVRRHGDFSIAVAGFPETHPDSPNREHDLKFLKQKIDAGADVVITQLFFDNRLYWPFAEDLKAMGVTIPIVPGIMPILSLEQVRRFCSTCGAHLPQKIQDDLETLGGDSQGVEEYCVELATRQIRELLDGGVPGIHLYCLNRSRLSKRIFAGLKEK